ncbi:MAG TPA: hypothetical protein DEQ38_01870 [Elusimicrobia bacterium]|nr:MAG: hypothetical protein A2089_07595 [Elusimicrobia bacterium GWD2_63_28]HCC46856.1 hypothetical protein [Elusimicrobiota bacterium]
MVIFWRLVLSHLLADFTLQFDVVNRMKRKNLWGMLLHCLTHFIVSAALVWDYLPETWFSAGGVAVSGWGALLLMMAIHFIVDQLRVYSMKTLGWKDNTASFLADQVLHFYVLFMIAPVVMPGPDLLMGDKWAAIASMLVLVTHSTTVLIYFVEKDLFGKPFPSFDEKYFLIFERVVLWAFFFAEGRWWIPFAIIWAAQLFYIRRKRIMDLSGINVWLSVVIAALLGACTRFVYYGYL